LRGAPTVIEDASTFEANATKKSVQLAQWAALHCTGAESAAKSAGAWFVLADDSGLEVDALRGAPGVHSARFAAQDPIGTVNSPDSANNEKLLDLLKNVIWENRTARFRCIVALTPIGLAPLTNASPVCAANEFELQTELFEGI